MTMDEVRQKIRRRAGVRHPRIPVRVVILEKRDLLPPSIRRKRRTAHEREVVVSAQWLMQKAPELWAAICAATLMKDPDALKVVPYKEDK